MATRYLRQIDSTRFDVPTVFVWARELAVQGNFRECDSKGALIKPGPQPWVDQWNNIHDPDEPSNGKAIDYSGRKGGADVVLQNMGSILCIKGVPVNHWVPNYIFDEVAKQDNAIDVIKAELEKNKVTIPVKNETLTFADYLRAYKEARKQAYVSVAKQDPDITEPKMIARFYELHPNLAKKKAHSEVLDATVIQPPAIEVKIESGDDVKKSPKRCGRPMKRHTPEYKTVVSETTDTEPKKPLEVVDATL